ncbi:MAG: hypothetical protein R2856_22075 [Caldilineaceae bacterium]
MENANDSTRPLENAAQNVKPDRRQRKEIPALLIEATPAANGLFNWILASPMILFVGWFWVDLFAFFDPIPWYWLDAVIAVLVYIFPILLPFASLPTVW